MGDLRPREKAGTVAGGKDRNQYQDGHHRARLTLIVTLCRKDMTEQR
jgi:hypothetical protein